MSEHGRMLFALALIAVGAIAFWLPSIIAFKRRLVNRWQILLLNVFLGGTGIGWMVAMLYAIRPVHYHDDEV